MTVVNDHAVLRYLERVLGVDVEALRAEIAGRVARSQGAPSVRFGDVRYIVRSGVVVTVLVAPGIPRFDLLARTARVNAGIVEVEP